MRAGPLPPRAWLKARLDASKACNTPNMHLRRGRWVPGEAEGAWDVPACQQQRGPLHQAPAGVLRVQPHDVSISRKCTFPGGCQSAASEPGGPLGHFHRPSRDTDMAQVCQPLPQHFKGSVSGRFSPAKNQKLKASSVPSAPPCWTGHCWLPGGQWLCQGSISQMNNCFSPCSPLSFQPHFLVQTSGSLAPLLLSSKTEPPGGSHPLQKASFNQPSA